MLETSQRCPMGVGPAELREELAVVHVPDAAVRPGLDFESDFELGMLGTGSKQ